MRVDVRCCGYIAVSQPFLYLFKAHAVGVQKACAAIESAISLCDNVLSRDDAAEKAKAVKQKSRLVKQLAETRLYDQAIAHVAAKRIEIDLDDGVKVNYAKFQGVEVASEGMKAQVVDLLAGI